MLNDHGKGFGGCLILQFRAKDSGLCEGGGGQGIRVYGFLDFMMPWGCVIEGCVGGGYITLRHCPLPFSGELSLNRKL